MAKQNKGTIKAAASNDKPSNAAIDLAAIPKVNQGNRELVLNSIMYGLQKLPYSTIRKDMDDWQIARQSAQNPYNPRRWKLMEIYADAKLDLHLKGILKKRILKIKNKKFKLVDANGEINEAATKELKKQKFRQFAHLSMLSLFQGYSLIELQGTKEVTRIKEIDPRLVIPNRFLFTSNFGDTEGYDYTAPPFDRVCIGVGEEDDLGELLALSIYAFIKKNAIGNWSEFIEIFGMPMRFAKTPSVDAKIKAQIEDMLDNMGSAAWGLFPEGTEIEVKENARPDTYKVFDQIIERINSEMSKAVLGNTMTTDNGSSKSQGEVHERTEEDVEADDKSFFAEVVNNQFLPFLIRRGLPFNGLTFDWDDAKAIPLTARADVDYKISQMGWKPSKKYIEQTYSIEVEEAPELPDPKLGVPPVDDPNQKPPAGKKPKQKQVEAIKYGDITAQIKELYGV
jgi:hypothetical protein